MSISFLASVASATLALPLIAVLALAASRTSLSVLPLGIVLLLGVLPNPALAGLQSSARALVRDDESPFKAFALGMRRHWRPATVAWLLSLPITLILLLNVGFYGGLFTRQAPTGLFVGPLELLWLTLLAFWLALHVYVFPLLLAQEHPTPMLVYRNAAVVVLTRPLYTLGVEVIWLCMLLFLSATGLAAVFGLMLTALVQQAAFLNVLPRLRSSA
jgi:hypothetical protein